MGVTLTIDVEREADGRWLAEVPELPGVLAYGVSEEDAVARAEALALRVFAERLEHGEAIGPRMLSRIAKNTGLTPEHL
jgi:predicted RNase H-like HicB family nuclease